ncbi:MAG TPA: hypothetical protein VN736_15395 [Candidatus Limnocylindrales bacterium]|nr:hypothetical protein [Candidatus Limnocylindrales bacterium]
MIKKLVIGFILFALALSFAGTVPSNRTYTITIAQPTVVNGTQLKAGDYKLSMGQDKITLVLGKSTVDVPAKFEANEKKFEDTALRLVSGALVEIRLGGTKTKIVLAQ